MTGPQCVNKKETAKLKQLQKPGDGDQQAMESEDKNCASYKWSVIKN
jgi:hypothetical protein